MKRGEVLAAISIAHLSLTTTRDLRTIEDKSFVKASKYASMVV
jgi:hypothetical protein